MQKYEYQSDIVRGYVAQGRAEGREQGLRIALAELVHAILGTLPAEYERALQAIGSEAELTALVAELGRAREAGDVEAVFARLLGRVGGSGG